MNYNVTLDGYTGVSALRFWCQKVLPLVFDDSLSYYELLNKVVKYLNDVISDLTTVEGNVDALHNAYQQLVEAYEAFTEDVNNRVDEALTNSQEALDIVSAAEGAIRVLTVRAENAATSAEGYSTTAVTASQSAAQSQAAASASATQAGTAASAAGLAATRAENAANSVGKKIACSIVLIQATSRLRIDDFTDFDTLKTDVESGGVIFYVSNLNGYSAFVYTATVDNADAIVMVYPRITDLTNPTGLTYQYAIWVKGYVGGDNVSKYQGSF